MNLSSKSYLAKLLGRWGLENLAVSLVNEGWLGWRVFELTAEDLADLGVPRALRGEILAELREAVSVEMAALLDDWMTPLAYTTSGYLREKCARLRLWSACDVVEMALRLVVIIGLAQMCKTHNGCLPRGRLARVFEYIRTPTLSHWRAMAVETCSALEASKSVECHELGALLGPITAMLSELVGNGGDTERNSLLRLRNMLAHGSVSIVLARNLAARWCPRIDNLLVILEPLAHLPLLARTVDDKVLRVRGEYGSVEIMSDIDPEVVGTRAGAAAIKLVSWVLPLPPFVLRGVPRVGEVRGSQEVAQIFLRRSEIMLEYIALGAEDVAFGQGDDHYVEEFERLFGVPQMISDRHFESPGFKRELRRDAEHLLGRTGELKTLWNCATGTEPSGLYWLYGPPGIGKSILMARLMVDLIDEEEKRRGRGSGEPYLVLAYRFRRGHESCRAQTFLRFLRERLAEAVNDPVTRGLDDLQAVMKLLPIAARESRVLVPIDGMDEILAEEPNFLSLDLASLVEAGGLWMCSGRPEKQLEEFMRLHDAREVLLGGLGGMETAAIREMILDKAGPLGRKLLASDRDIPDGQSVVNAFVDAVERKANGLPLYVRYVIGDILGNRLRYLNDQEGENLPPSLTDYYEKLVQRCAVGDNHVLATYALCLLALAHETLSEAAIADLIGRRLPLIGDKDAQRLQVRAALGLLSSMLTLSFTPDGEIGFRIYHESLREYLQHAPSLAIIRRDTRKNILCKEAMQPGNGSAAHYLYRAGVRHLIESGDADCAVKMLTDVEFIVERFRKIHTAEIVTQSVAEMLLLKRIIEDKTELLNWWSRFWSLFESQLVQIAVQNNFGCTDLVAALIQLIADTVSDNSTANLIVNSGKLHVPQPFAKLSRSVPIRQSNLIRSIEHPDKGGIYGMLVVGQRLVSWERNGLLRFWSLTGDPLPNCENRVHPGVIQSRQTYHQNVLAIDDKLVSWDSRGAIRFWSLSGGQLAGGDDNAHSSPILGVARVTGGLISWGFDNMIRFWSLNGERLSTVIEGAHADNSYPINVIEVGDNLASSDHNGAIRFWSRAGERLRGGDEKAHPCSVRGMLVVGQRLISWVNEGLCDWDDFSEDGYAVRFWTLDGDPLPGGSREIHPAFTGRDQLALEEMIVSWDNHGAIRFWSADLERLPGGDEKAHSGAVEGVLALPDRLVSWGHDGAIRFWLISGDMMLNEAISTDSSRIYYMHNALVVDDRLVTSDSLGTIRFWSTTGERLAGGDERAHRGFNGVNGLLDIGDRLVTWCGSEIRCWSKETGKVLSQIIHPHSGGLTAIRGVLADEERLVSWGEDGAIRFWSLGGEPLPGGNDQAHNGYVVGLLKIGERLISWGSDGAIQFWSLSSGRLICCEKNAHSGGVQGVIVVGDQLASWGNDNHYDPIRPRIRFWTQSGEHVPGSIDHMKLRHPYINGVIAIDRNFVTWDNTTIRFWSGKSKRLLYGHDHLHEGRINGVLATESRIVSWGGDGAIRFWSAEGMSLQGGGCAHKGSTGSWLSGVYGMFNMRNWIVSWGSDRTIKFWTKEGEAHACWIQPDFVEANISACGERLFVLRRDGPRELIITPYCNGPNHE